MPSHAETTSRQFEIGKSYRKSPLQIFQAGSSELKKTVSHSRIIHEGENCLVVYQSGHSDFTLI
jgi:hypothetical protein